MSINLDELSVDELEKLIKQAESALDKKRKAELKNAQAVLEKMAKDLGVSPEALLKDTAGKKKATRKKATKKKATKKKVDADENIDDGGQAGIIVTIESAKLLITMFNLSQEMYESIETEMREEGTWEIEFPKYSDGSSNTTFNDILNEVKRECEFRMVLEDGGEYICYSCPNSFFEKGLGNSYIGFKRKKSSDVVSIVLSID